VKYKTIKEELEYVQLWEENERLAYVAQMLDTFSRLEFKKEITITHIFRTPEEHAALYAQTPADERPATSPHMSWEAIDIRSSDFAPDQITRMVRFLNCLTYRAGKPTAIYHQVAGNAFHFHIQVTKGKL
jgi:hypothetical protein